MLTYQTPAITLEPAATKPLYRQIADSIVRAIEEKQLNPEIPIASTRQLAATLNVHRKTVVEAYERLIGLGWLYTIPNKGTFISPERHERFGSLKGITVDNISFTYHEFEPPALPQGPGQRHWEVRFDDGVPDPGLSSIKQFMLSYVRAFIQKVRLKKLEMFENPIEHPDALAQLNRMLNMYRGFTVPAANHCFIFGNNISLYLVSQVLFEIGDVVLVENPGSPQAWEVFRKAGATIIPAEVDEQGIVTDKVKALCRNKKIKAVYVTPASQYPTTVTMSAERRAALLQLAREHGFAIIEADYDYEFWYGDEPARALIADDTNGNVIFLGCLSRMLPPFNFIGFVAGPAPFMRSLRALWGSMGHQGDAVLELALLGFMKEGAMIRYARKSSNVYKEKRMKVAEVLDKYLGDSISYAIPQAGLAFYIRFKGRIDIQQLLLRLNEKDIYIPSPELFVYERKPMSVLRFGFASLPVSKIEIAVKLVGEILQYETAEA